MPTCVYWTSHPLRLQRLDVIGGTMPPPDEQHLAGALRVAQVLQIAGNSVMCAPERIESPTSVDVLLDHGLDDLLGRPVQARVDHLEPGVAQRAGDDLGAAVVTVEAGLGDQNAELTRH